MKSIICGPSFVVSIMVGEFFAPHTPSVYSQEEAKTLIKITGPESGGQFITIRGQAAGFPPGKVIIRAVVQADIFYTQLRGPAARIGPDGSFAITAQIGRAGSVDVGKKFTVYVYACEAEQRPPVFGEEGLKVSEEKSFRKMLMPHVYQQNPNAISAGFMVIRK
jgi:hypothetical protein